MKKSKVAVVACPDYEPARVKESLQKGLEAIGGLESLIGKEENILLKPNLVRSAKRERAVVTDPEVMDALITILQENGYENISCGDSCGLGTPEGIAKEAGLKEVLEKHNVPLKDFLTSERVETADGKFLMIAKDALDCDALISVSKMKTHALERITGAVKNQYGCISGVYKKLGHTQYPNDESFAHMLIELNQKVAPRLYICDGIVAMEGNGPTSGDPVSMGVLLMSTDPIAGYRVLPSGEPRSVVCADKSLRGNARPWNVARRPHRNCDSGWHHIRGRTEKKVRKSKLQCRPPQSPQKRSPRSARDPRGLPEPPLYHRRKM